MDKVPTHTSRERSDQGMAFFELTKSRLYLGPHVEECYLPRCCNRFVLRMVWWCNHNGAVLLPESLTHHTTTIVTVADQYAGTVVDELLHVLVVMLAGWREDNRCEPVIVVNRSMELKAIVPALPVLTELRYTPRDLMPVSPDGFADR